MARRKGTLTLRREDGRIVCDAVTVADGTFSRMRGLLGRGSLAPDQGIVLRPAWSIHTAFMRFAIDVVFIDAEQTVIRIAPRVRAFKTASCRGAREVVELAAGECERRGLAEGDRVAWASRSATVAPATLGSIAASGRHGNVVVASPDPRFVKLARFLLESRDLSVADVGVPVLSDWLPDAQVDAVLFDAGGNLGDGLRALNAIRAQRPELAVVLVAEAPGEEAPTSVQIYDKWQQTEAAIGAVAAAVAGAEPSGGE